MTENRKLAIGRIQHPEQIPAGREVTTQFTAGALNSLEIIGGGGNGPLQTTVAAFRARESNAFWNMELLTF